MNRVGVTGHRSLADAVAVVDGIETALRRIESLAGPAPLTAISPLAEGADRLVAECVLARPAARLIVPLPLPREDYILAFASKDSKRHFAALFDRADEVVELPPQLSRSRAYRAAGLYVLDHSDVLIAVWDGEPGRGISGTAEIVAEARRRGLPMAWIHARRRAHGTTETVPPGGERTIVTFANL